MQASAAGRCVTFGPATCWSHCNAPHRLADLDGHRTGDRLEMPRNAGGVGVETDGDIAVEYAVGILLRGAAGRAAITGRLAEHRVKRHGGVGHADHAGEKGKANTSDNAVGLLLSGIFDSSRSSLPHIVPGGWWAGFDDGRDVEDDHQDRQRQADGDRAVAPGFLLTLGQRDQFEFSRPWSCPARWQARARRRCRPDRRRRWRTDRAANRRTAPWRASSRGRRRPCASTFHAYQTKPTPSSGGNDAITGAGDSRGPTATRRPAPAPAHRRRSDAGSTPRRRRSASSACRRGHSRRT